MEMVHALTRAERKGIIPKGQGRVLFDDFLTACPILFPYAELIDRAMELSSDLRIGVFDCVYVALAEEEQCQVISADLKLVKLFPTHVTTLDSL